MSTFVGCMFGLAIDALPIAYIYALCNPTLSLNFIQAYDISITSGAICVALILCNT